MASSTQYSGRPDNETIGTDINIASSTNTTPIVVTTSTPHGLLDGAKVLIRNHVTNVTANGIWSVVVLTGSTLALYQTYGGTASIGTAAAGASGTVRPLGLLPSYLIPDDTSVGAADINVGLEDHGDRSQWLAQRVGSRYLAQEFDLSANGLTAGAAPTAWLAGASITASNAGWNYDAGVQLAQILDVYSGDIVDFSFSTTVDTKTDVDVTEVAFAMHYALSDYGVAPNFVTATKVDGGLVIDDALIVPLTLVGRIPIVIATPKMQQLSLVLKYLGFTAFNRKFQLCGDYKWTARVLRPR
jgi:hypothetical protein